MDKNENDDKIEAPPPPLPLGWTQVRRKKRTRDDNDNNAANEIDWCCDDPNCKRIEPDAGENQAPANATTIKGHAIFCLHEMNPDWFQGYLQLEGQRKPWGLLAIQETIDECLECKDGGYRQVTLKVLKFNSKEPQILEHVQWTGGDMMRLESAHVSMETHSLWTGKKAVPYVDKYFGSLVDKLRENADDCVVDIFPELAIVTGPMTLTLSPPGNGDASENANLGNSNEIV